MTLEIHLLGPPRVLHDGVERPAPRGHKVWALLAYLLCSGTLPSRAHLADQLFEDAEDPLGALRWNLSELRRLLPESDLRGDAPQLHLPADARVDVQLLAGSAAPQVLGLPGLGRELLEGMRFGATPAFAVWLDSQRRRFMASSEAVLREAALANLGMGAAEQAARIAGRLVQLNPLDESHQALLVRSLAAAGEGIAAARQFAACAELLRRELGTSPGPALRAAAATTTAQAVARPAGGRASAEALLEAGEAAVRAGAHDAGLQCLRQAAADAESAGDAELRVRARLALGSALVHGARGHDEEGAVALHEALALAEAHGVPQAAAACRELGYIEFLQARYDRAEVWLARAASHTDRDGPDARAVATLLGSVRSDTADYESAAGLLASAVTMCRRAADERQLAYALSMLGRLRLLRGDLDEAAGALDESAAIARGQWTAFLAWPQALRAEVDLLRGDVPAAAERLDGALALSCQLGDPCWEALARRGLGVVAAARGNPDAAIEQLCSAVACCARLPDTYLWAKAHALEALCGIAVEHQPGQAAAWLEELQELASRSGMREMVARAHVHGARLGMAGSAAAARALAAQIGNPRLDRIQPS